MISMIAAKTMLVAGNRSGVDEPVAKKGMCLRPHQQERQKAKSFYSAKTSFLCPCPSSSGLGHLSFKGIRVRKQEKGMNRLIALTGIWELSKGY